MLPPRLLQCMHCSVTGTATIVSHPQLTGRPLIHLTVVLTILRVACTTCTLNLLMPFRLWRTQLQQKHPKWAVTPKNGGVWKELVVVATQLEALASYEICLDLHRRLKWQSTEDSGTQVATHRCMIAQITQTWMRSTLTFSCISLSWHVPPLC